MKPMYHIAKREDWEAAKTTGEYTISTLGKTLEEVGFIHMSFAHQVDLVANFIYKDEPDLVLLKINPEKLKDPVRVEGTTGTDEKFPHLYGPLNIEAVDEVVPFAPNAEGKFVFKG